MHHGREVISTQNVSIRVMAASMKDVDATAQRVKADACVVHLETKVVSLGRLGVESVRHGAAECIG